MDCRDAQFYLRMRRHATDELGVDVTAPLNDHLATCPACAADARALVSFDRALSSAMVAVPMSSALRERLISHVASKQGTILRHKAYKAGGLVAVALLLIGIGFSVFSNTRPPVDTESLVRTNDEQLSAAELSTQKWLAAEKLPDRLPLPFDYDLLTFRGFEKVQGNNVPVVVFRSRTGSGFAKVYIFAHDGRFDLKNVQDAQASLTRAEVVVKQHNRGGVTYVFVHTGGPEDGLRQFLRNDGRPVDPA